MGIQVEESENSLCLSWDYRKLAKKRFLACFLVCFWLAWTLITLFVSGLAWQARGVQLVFFLIWLTFGWLGVITIPYTLLMRRWRESLTIDQTSLTFAYSGLLAKRPRTIPLSSIASISLGHVDGADGGESIQTLNVYLVRTESVWSRRQMVAYWLPDEMQEQLFEALEAFGELHDLGVQMTRLD